MLPESRGIVLRLLSVTRCTSDNPVTPAVERALRPPTDAEDRLCQCPVTDTCSNRPGLPSFDQVAERRRNAALLREDSCVFMRSNDRAVRAGMSEPILAMLPGKPGLHPTPPADFCHTTTTREPCSRVRPTLVRRFPSIRTLASRPKKRWKVRLTLHLAGRDSPETCVFDRATGATSRLVDSPCDE